MSGRQWLRSPQPPRRAHAAPERAEDRDADAADPMLRLQHSAGNRAVLATLQRHLAPTQPEEVGEEPAQGTTTAEVEPGTGTGTGTAGGGTTGPTRAQRIEALLGTTDTGRWALGVVRRWSIPVDYNYAGQGSFHRAGSIFINRALSIAAAAMVMYHEAQHANTFKSGTAADVNALSRAEYVRLKIADEAEAVVRQIEGTVPLQARGESMAGSGLTTGLIDRYRAAFYRERDRLERDEPTLSRAEINRRCRQHTRDTEVTNWFHDGTFVTSTGSITYSEHYGRAWDAVRNPPSATGGGG